MLTADTEPCAAESNGMSKCTDRHWWCGWACVVCKDRFDSIHFTNVRAAMRAKETR